MNVFILVLRLLIDFGLIFAFALALATLALLARVFGIVIWGVLVFGLHFGEMAEGWCVLFIIGRIIDRSGSSLVLLDSFIDGLTKLVMSSQLLLVELIWLDLAPIWLIP